MEIRFSRMWKQGDFVLFIFVKCVWGAKSEVSRWHRENWHHWVLRLLLLPGASRRSTTTALGPQICLNSTTNCNWYINNRRVQRRATKFILSIPYRTDTPYSARLQTISIIPVCYWHEYLDFLCLYKCILSNDINVSIWKRCIYSELLSGIQDTLTFIILLNVPKGRTVSYQNSFYGRAPSVWNILPGYMRDTSRSLDYLKKLST